MRTQRLQIAASVREKLAARTARVHTIRQARRAAVASGAPKELQGPESEDEGYLPKKKKKKKKKKRKKRSSDKKEKDRDRKRRQSRQAAAAADLHRCGAGCGPGERGPVQRDLPARCLQRERGVRRDVDARNARVR